MLRQPDIWVAHNTDTQRTMGLVTVMSRDLRNDSISEIAVRAHTEASLETNPDGFSTYISFASDIDSFSERRSRGSLSLPLLCGASAAEQRRHVRRYLLAAIGHAACKHCSSHGRTHRHNFLLGAEGSVQSSECPLVAFSVRTNMWMHRSLQLPVVQDRNTGLRFHMPADSTKGPGQQSLSRCGCGLV